MKVSLGFTLQDGAFGGGNQFGRLLTQYLTTQGVTVTHDLSAPDLDIILLMEPDIGLQTSAYNHHDILHYLRQVNPKALVVQRFNNTSQAQRDASDHYNQSRIAANRVADYSIFVSQWAYEAYVESGYDSPHYRIILNGGDASLWYPRQNVTPSKPLSIVTHHWSTHPNKGFDIYQHLDQLLSKPPWSEQVKFTYIGRVPEGLQFSATRYVPPLSGQALADELRKHDIYLTASRNEAGPNHCIEGAMCGLPLLYIESGAMLEYCAGFGQSFTPDNFEIQLETMLAAHTQWSAKMPTYPHTAEKTCQGYYILFDELLSQRESIIAQRNWALPAIDGDRHKAVDWIEGLRDPLINYVQSLQVEDVAGRYLPMKEGLTNTGETIALPFSCLALQNALHARGMGYPPQTSARSVDSHDSIFPNARQPLAPTLGTGWLP